MSRNANVPSVSSNTSAGMSPARILQNRQSSAIPRTVRGEPDRSRIPSEHALARRTGAGPGALEGAAHLGGAVRDDELDRRIRVIRYRVRAVRCVVGPPIDGAV